MPTGYTAGILNGKITTFPQFAKQCMRAFGATIHMRDDDMDAEIVPRTPSDYHTKEIEAAKQILLDAETLPDEVIIDKRKKELEESKQYHIKSINKAITDTKNMNAILEDVKAWQPPTPEHSELKKFMIDQIVKTIDFDCKTEYHDKVERELQNIDAKAIRIEMIAKANKELEYHEKELNKEIERCDQSNKWVSDLINSLSAVVKNF